MADKFYLRASRRSIRPDGQKRPVRQLETLSLPDDDAALQEKAAYLIDHCSPFANKAGPYAVQRLQIEWLIGHGWNKTRRRSLHGLGHSMSISKVILSLSKRLRIGRRDLLHIVSKRRIGATQPDQTSRKPQTAVNPSSGPWHTTAKP